jgi:hypothetical protein
MTFISIILTLIILGKVRWIFPITNYTQTYTNFDEITLTIFTDIIILLTFISLYFWTNEILDISHSQGQITLFLKLPNLFD